MLIVLTGIDGSGKSTAAQALVSAVRADGGMATLLNNHAGRRTMSVLGARLGFRLPYRVSDAVETTFRVWNVLVNHPRVRQGMLNSILITAVGVTINIALTTLMAWGLSRPGLPGRRAVYVLVLVTIVFEPGMLPDYFFNKQFGLLDTYWSVIMYKAVNAWYLIILVRFFEEIPEDLIEAARIDGANPFQTFYMVVLPLAKPAIATIALFYIVFHWNEFFRPLLYLNDQDKWPLQLVLRQFVVEGDKLSIVGLEDMGTYTDASQLDLRAFKAGMIILTIAPILLIYPLILRYFTKGTMTGAVKG